MIAQHVRVKYVVYIVHGAQIVDKHFALRYLGIIHARIVAAGIASDLHMATTDRLEDFIIAQIAIVKATAYKVIQEHLNAALRGLQAKFIIACL